MSGNGSHMPRSWIITGLQSLPLPLPRKTQCNPATFNARLYDHISCPGFTSTH
ncbi:hypothetical protein BDV09DRAFT_159329 [Aspergillus tetrazonus]